MIKTVHTAKAPAAIGPYSQAMIYNNMIYLSGQIPINPETGEITGSNVTEQTEQVIRNISEVLKEAGSGFSKVIKTTCFLQDLADFAAFNSVYEKYFTGKPARSCIEVAGLPKGSLVEIEVIAGIF